MKISRSIRVFKLLTAIQSGSCSFEDLVEVSGMSRRTVFRDLEAIQKIGVPVEYDHRTRTYSVRDGYFFRPASLTVQEALGVLLALRRICSSANLPYKSAILSATMKIECTLSPPIRRQCEAVLRSVSVDPLPRAQAPLLDCVFSCLQKAIQDRRVICMAYRDEEDRRGPVRVELRPLHLIYGEDKWYVLGRADRDRNIRSFRLDRIGTVEFQDKLFLEEEGFSASDHLGNAWRVQPEGLLHRVRLRFCPEIANDVSAVQWHHTQTTSRCPDGSVVMEFRVDGLGEILWWVLSYGDQVQVLQPRALRERVRHIAMRTARAYDRTHVCSPE